MHTGGGPRDEPPRLYSRRWEVQVESLVGEESAGRKKKRESSKDLDSRVPVPEKKRVYTPRTEVVNVYFLVN